MDKDLDVLETLMRELRSVARTGDLPIAVEVAGGIVTLEGHVGTAAARAAAYEAARRVEGVLIIANDIVVTGTPEP